jgi:hypothetical protein
VVPSAAAKARNCATRSTGKYHLLHGIRQS